MALSRQSLLTCIFLFLIVGCNPKPDRNDDASDPLVINRDTTLTPGVNFFRYANGSWFASHPIPESESNNGIFRTIGDTINAQVRKVSEQAVTAAAEVGSNKQKIGDFYFAGMDTSSIESAGINPLTNELDKIEAIKDIRSLMNSIGHLHTIGVNPAFSFYVGQDDRISTKHALFFNQGGLGLGNRDYYFNRDPRTVNIRNEYLDHIRAMLMLIGSDEPKAIKSATKILALETDLASASRKLEALRDPVKNYNKMGIGQLNKLTPLINWNEVLPELGIQSADTVIVGQPEFYKALNTTLKKYTLGDWKVYLKWYLVSEYSFSLNKALVDQNFKFHSTVLNGVKKQKPRWKRVGDQTNQYLGELIGQVYVNEYLPKGSKEKLLEIGNSIREVFGDHIRNLDWMSETTKVKALDKLNKMVMKVGYPDQWKDMSALEIDRQSYCSNVMRANAWFYTYEANKYGKPVDRKEWDMYPQTYNAYYNPSNNEIVVPACNILVPGFEGRMPDDAILYGIIGGSTFGHEITHGFDDQGSQYDANGNLNNWWTEEDRAKFISKTRLIVNQYSDFVVLDSIHVNGDATQGENIADLGGVVVGYEAFQKTPQYKENRVINGLTPDQRYFLAYGYAWMTNIKNEALARRIMTDVHAPSEFRVNGPLSNMPVFYKTFNVGTGDAMYRPDSIRVVIW